MRFGKNTAGDSTALAGRAKKDTEAVADEIKQGLPQPTGGRKEYKDDQGRVTKVYEWFGYKLHLLVDVDNEVSVAYAVSDTKTPDNEMIEPLTEQALANLLVPACCRQSPTNGNQGRVLSSGFLASDERVCVPHLVVPLWVVFPLFNRLPDRVRPASCAGQADPVATDDSKSQ